MIVASVKRLREEIWVTREGPKKNDEAQSALARFLLSIIARLVVRETVRKKWSRVHQFQE